MGFHNETDFVFLVYFKEQICQFALKTWMKILFWFLNKNGLVISKCGFFVAYRNANYHHTEEDGSIVYTDAHTGTTRIKIGEVVTMPREDCDTVQEHTCSQGLHCGSSWWLKRNYFGNNGLVVLVNPADVVAVP